MQLGAVDIVPLGLGDDQAKYGYLTAFYPWWNNLFIELKAFVGASAEVSPPLYSYYVERIVDLSEQILPLDRLVLFSSICPHIKSRSKHGRLLSATVLENKRLTSPDWFQDVRNISFQICENEAELAYDICDIAAVYPITPIDAVQRAIAVMALPHGLTATTILRISNLSTVKRASRLSTLQNTITIFEMFSYALDICGIPQRSYFEGIAPFAESHEEKDKLMELASAEGMDVFYDYVIREKRNYIEVLEDFRSCRPPLEKLLELLPIIQPRQYSIASYFDRSSQLAASGNILFDLCVSRSHVKTRHGRIINGRCSNFLCNLQAGEIIHFYIQGSVLSTNNMTKPLILIGPGTGVAPMRALVKRHALHYQNKQNVSPCILFCGFRKRTHDFLYEDEWKDIFDCTNVNNDDSFYSIKEHMENVVRDESGYTGINMSVAFSRDRDESLPKIYVMNKLILHGAYLWRLIHDKGGSILVSGSATKMPRDVRTAIANICRQHGGLSKEEANQYLLQLERNKRYIVEAWS